MDREQRTGARRTEAPPPSRPRGTAAARPASGRSARRQEAVPGIGAGQQVAVGQHRRPRLARGAGCEHERAADLSRIQLARRRSFVVAMTVRPGITSTQARAAPARSVARSSRGALSCTSTGRRGSHEHRRQLRSVSAAGSAAPGSRPASRAAWMATTASAVSRASSATRPPAADPKRWRDWSVGATGAATSIDPRRRRNAAASGRRSAASSEAGPLSPITSSGARRRHRSHGVERHAQPRPSRQRHAPVHAPPGHHSMRSDCRSAPVPRPCARSPGMVAATWSAAARPTPESYRVEMVTATPADAAARAMSGSPSARPHATA